MPQPSAANSTCDAELGLDCCVAYSEEEQPLLVKGDPPAKIEDYGGTDIVQFNSFIYYADELDGLFKVEIIRLGTMIGRVAVKYSTSDLSAVASEQYEASSGVVIFEDGEYRQSVAIPIRDDGVWSSCKEFRVKLESPENCLLGLYLHHCRVKILNAEMFPSDRFKEELDAKNKSVTIKEDIESGKGHGDDDPDLLVNIKQISNWELFFEYWKLNFESAGVKYKTVLVMIFDQISAVMLFVTLYVGVYLVDTIFARGVSSQQHLLLPDRYHTACLVAAWYIVPHMVLLAWEALKVYIDIKGPSREFLQMSMMRTTMDYSQSSRNKVSAGDINVAVVVNAETVAVGYVAALSMVGILGRLASIQLFIIYFQPDRLAVCSGILMFALVVIFMALRVDLAVATQDRLEDKIMRVGTITDESNQKYRLFSDYFKRGVLVDLFSKAVKDYSREKINDTCHHLLSQFAPKIIAGAITANYIVFRTNDVLNGHLSLGVFLASITIFVTYMVNEIADLNNQLILIVDAFACLKEFTRYLNLPLELESLIRSTSTRRMESNTQIQRLSRTFTETSFKHDHIPITATNLSFDHFNGRSILKDTNISIAQGHLVAVTGAHNSGKATLIQLFAGILTPSKGSLFVPSHLRILHVSREPVFMHTSMLHNMSLGLPHPTRPTQQERDRITRILFELDLHDVVDIMNDEENGTCTSARTPRSPVSARPINEQDIEFKNSAEMAWEQSLTQSEKVKLHIARALVSNPEVMIVERTLQGLNYEHATGLLNVLRRHVNEKGLCLPTEDHVHRRPRTVIFSTELADHAAQADSVLELDTEKQSVVQTDCLAAKTGPKPQFLKGCLPLRSSR